jgi:hypothetical protein
VTIAREEKAGFSLQYYLRNMMFSLATTLEGRWLLQIMPLYLAVFLVSMVAAALVGREASAIAHFKALSYNLRHLPAIKSHRACIQALRKQSDHDIFMKAMRTPRLDYFVKTFTGRLADYAD